MFESLDLPQPATGDPSAPATKYAASSAHLSPCGRYRYWLSRDLTVDPKRTVLFVGLNPSTADATVDDATIRKCVGFARRWGFDRLIMGNVCAWRDRHPSGLKRADDPVGPENASTLESWASGADLVIAAWGQNKLPFRAQRIAAWVLALPQVRCLGRNADGTPKHPLFVPYATPLESLVTGAD